jgi:hypothetical protein
MICPNCGASNTNSDQVCPDCGITATPAWSTTTPGTDISSGLSPEIAYNFKSDPPPKLGFFLIHTETRQRFKLPIEKQIVYIGKLNKDLPPDIDLSELAHADIVSRIHAAIHNQEFSFFLEDAGSSNGTFLNGELIKPGARYRRALRSKDRITLGKGEKVAFIFEVSIS